MKKLLSLIALFFSISLSAQTTHKYESRAVNLFNLNISDTDFTKGKVFLTLDTINMSDLSYPSTYIETDKPAVIIKNFVDFMKSIKIEGSYYNYYELINSPIYESPLNISFIMNTKTASYLVRIWTDKNNIDKIEGITVGKYSQKQVRTL